MEYILSIQYCKKIALKGTNSMDFNIEEDDVCTRTSQIEDIITLKPKDAYVYLL